MEIESLQSFEHIKGPLNILHNFSLIGDSLIKLISIKDSVEQNGSDKQEIDSQVHNNDWVIEIRFGSKENSDFSKNAA
jgi:hypothetical protein